MRILKRALGPQSSRPSQPSIDPEHIQSVTLTPLVVAFLKEQMDLPGRTRGGLLFGHHHKDNLHVLLASSGGQPWWYRPGDKSWVLEIDQRFTMGWSEAVLQVLQGYADWCANWVIFPDEQLGDEKRARRWLRHGARLGVIDDRHPLLVAGFDPERFAVQAWFHYPDEPLMTPCILAEGTLATTLRDLADLIDAAE